MAWLPRAAFSDLACHALLQPLHFPRSDNLRVFRPVHFEFRFDSSTFPATGLLPRAVRQSVLPAAQLMALVRSL